jgi:hypothetical protein
MRQRWIGVAAGVLTIVSGSIVRADDVGCLSAAGNVKQRPAEATK